MQTECLPTPSCDEVALIESVERAIHPSASEWLFLRELRVGTGRENGGAQRLDAFALNTLPHMAMKRVCYEVKTSRADFLSELKRPLKRRIGMRYSNEFYFVTPAALVGIAEIPSECGLVEAGYATFVGMEATNRSPRRFLQLRSRDPGVLHDYRASAMAGYSRPDVATRCRHASQPAPTVIETPPARPVQERLELLQKTI